MFTRPDSVAQGGKPSLVYDCPRQVPMSTCSSSSKIWGWAVTQKKVLKWFNYPHTRTHPGCEFSCHGAESTCSVSLSVLHQCQPDSGEGCIMLQSGPTRSLVGKLPQCSVVACSMWISVEECCEWGRRRVCVNLWGLMSWCPKRMRTIAAMWVQRTYLQIHCARI